MSADSMIASSMSIKDLLGILWCFGRGRSTRIDGIINRNSKGCRIFGFLDLR